MAAAPGPPVPQTSASPALPLPTEPVQVPAAFSLWLPGLHRCEGAGFMEPPPLLRLGRRAGICALHPTLSAPGSSPPPSPPPPPSQGLREAGRRVMVSGCQLPSQCFWGPRGKSIYKLLSLWTSDPAGARESGQRPARPQRRKRSGWARGRCWGAGAQWKWPAHGGLGPSYPAHSGRLHGLGCRRTGTRRRGPGRSPRAGTAGIGTRRFLSEEGPGARRRERPQG